MISLNSTSKLVEFNNFYTPLSLLKSQNVQGLKLRQDISL